MSSDEYRLSFREAGAVLARRLDEPAPGRIQLLAGPRQVGKTTLLLELAERLGNAAIYVAADGPGGDPAWLLGAALGSRRGDRRQGRASRGAPR
ncbi:MAG: hypothetical protein IPG96_21540 [Proteobacteria bacterium]|nr:hypothetical protein [Pseudomonadota bacterium]